MPPVGPAPRSLASNASGCGRHPCLAGAHSVTGPPARKQLSVQTPVGVAFLSPRRSISIALRCSGARPPRSHRAADFGGLLAAERGSLSPSGRNARKSVAAPPRHGFLRGCAPPDGGARRAGPRKMGYAHQTGDTFHRLGAGDAHQRVLALGAALLFGGRHHPVQGRAHHRLPPGDQRHTANAARQDATAAAKPQHVRCAGGRARAARPL